jgi:negative regulator of sigma E activity
MPDEPKPDDRKPDELDEYLRGDSALSRQYRREAAPLPPHALDRQVLAAARVTSARSQNLAPLAFAACVFLSVALVLAMVLSPPSSKKADDTPHVVQVRSYKSELPRAALASPREREPAKWLSNISALRRAGRDAEADAEMRRFRSAYPDYMPAIDE